MSLQRIKAVLSRRVSDDFCTLPLSLKWLLLFEGCLAPYLIYAVLAFSPHLSRMDDYVAWLLMIICVLPSMVYLQHGRRVWFGYAMTLVITIAVCALWSIYADGPQVVWMFPLLIFASLYRMHRLLVRPHLHDENKLAFRLDCGLVIAGVVCSAAFMGTRGSNFSWIVLNGLAAIVFRVYSLWLHERHTHERQAGPKGMWFWMAGLFLALVFLVPDIGPYVVGAVLFLFGVVVSPLLFLVSPTFHFKVKPQAHQADPHSGDDQLYVSPPVQHQSVITAVGVTVLCIVILAIVILVMVRLRQRKEMPIINGIEPPKASRKWLLHRDRLKFMTTNNRVRLELQRWLEREHSAGRAIQPHESLREFTQRLESTGTGAAVSEALIERYEGVRYELRDED